MSGYLHVGSQGMHVHTRQGEIVNILVQLAGNFALKCAHVHSCKDIDHGLALPLTHMHYPAFR